MAVTSQPAVKRGIRHLRDPGSVHVVQTGLIDYPRAGKQGVMRWIPSWRQALAVMGLGFLGISFGLLVAYARTPVPQPNPDAAFQKTIVYWGGDKKESKREIARFGDIDRHIVDGQKIKQHVKDAVIAAEDRSFRTNRGISPTGILRAAWNNVRGGSLQGGSTITQQYVKNAFLDSQDRTWKRKSKEFFVSVKVARDVDKDQILENYLNTIYFGRRAYGIDAAAQAYYYKSASQLTVSEAAFLAGIINGPELYDPDDGADSTARAKVRWNYVLNGMIEMGTLTEAQRPKKFPKPRKQRSNNGWGGQRGYLMGMVRKELGEKYGLDQKTIDTGGLVVRTTFDEKMVDAGVEAVRNTLPSQGVPSGLQVAIATVDVKTGAVRAIYGGRDYVKVRQQNAATRDSAQAGSTFKPFCLVAALRDGVSLRSRFDGGSPRRFDGLEKPVRNFANTPYGYIDLPFATAHSVNTVYVALNQEVGPRVTRQTAYEAGLPEGEGTRGLDNGLGNVLGSTSVHPIDMATAYATFAAQGERHERYVVEEVQWPNGDVRRHRDSFADQEPVFEPDVMADTVYAMQQVVQAQGGSGGYARALGRPVAGKTGTSTDSKSAWFVGFTPQLSTSVAMYRLGKNGAEAAIPPFGGFGSITGSSFPVRIWTAYMQEALRDTPVEEFPPPAWGGEIKGLPPMPSWTVSPSFTERPTGFPTSSMTMTPEVSVPEMTTRDPFPTETEEPVETEEPPETSEPDRTVAPPDWND